MKTKLPHIFISYSHKDEEKKDALIAQLSVLESASLVDVWVDDKIGAGADWEQEINEALAQAKIAIFLITANFLTSNFILSKEVPTILSRRKNEGMFVIPIIAEACAWEAVGWLNQMNVRPKNGTPIWGTKDRYPANDLANIAREILSIIKQIQKDQYRIFISYTQRSDIDKELAYYLREQLEQKGHEIFIDQRLRAGDAWMDVIDQEIQSSDFLVVLLSKDSVNSEMVRAEVMRANEYRQNQNKPQTLPIRVNYSDMLPYAIAAKIDSLQYVMWKTTADNERVAQEILGVIEGKTTIAPPPPPPLPLESPPQDEDSPELHPPLPEFDPRILRELEVPGGAVRIRDKFYVQREADEYLNSEIVKLGKVITIRAPRQMGKTSLLIRGVRAAHEQGIKTAFVDLQGFGHDHLASASRFLREFAELICRELRIDSSKLDKKWEGDLGPFNKLTYFMEDEVLPTIDGQLVLAIDEADTLMKTEFYAPFFGLLRSWYNRGTRYPEWEQLSIVLVISTEPYLLIDDPNQSPFNIGLRLDLSDFSEQEVQSLNQQHGNVVNEQDFPELMKLLGGHPYLIRKALYAMVKRQITWNELVKEATKDDGQFGDHLRHHHWILRDHPELIEAFKEILLKHSCSDEMAAYRLVRSGLVKQTSDSYQCRCDLYRIYFSEKFL